MGKKKNPQLSTFIEGELINLCIPSRDFAKFSKWHSWFNDNRITKYIEQGVYPNSPKKQLDYFDNLEKERITLIITEKNNSAFGVISLSFINLSRKSCDISLIVSNDGNARLRPYMSLEAMALMTEHAFNKVGMHRVNAGQHIKLSGWQTRLELIGYQLEGLHENKFVKGIEVANTMSIAIIRKNYELIIKNRNGKLWDSFVEMKSRVKLIPKIPFVDKLTKFYETERLNYYKKVFLL